MLINYKKKIHKKCISINLTDKEKSDSQGNHVLFPLHITTFKVI